MGVLIVYKFRYEIYYKFASSKTYEIVILGNSLVANCNWDEELGRFDVKGNGFHGNTSSHYIYKLQKYVIDLKPKICFIEGGINDINVGIPLSRTFENYRSIVDTLLKHKIKPVLQSTLFINQYNDRIINENVDSLNQFLFDLAILKGLQYLDMNKYLSENKRLKKEFTTDGIHLNEAAYKIWAAEIKKVLKTEKI